MESLIIQYDGDTVFTSHSNWLHPLFELEDQLAALPEDERWSPAAACLRDKIIGRGAAFLIARLGFKTCHGGIVSRRALDVMERFGIEIGWDTLVDRIDCVTEDVLEHVVDVEAAYAELARRAGRKA